MPRDVILTGVPRGGTTLLTALTDALPDAVALNEPRWQYDWIEHHRATATPQGYAAWLAQDFAQTRERLLRGEPIPERRGENMEAVTNYYRPDPEKGGQAESYRIVPFTRAGLTADFLLAMKHNGLYLQALQEIAESGRFTVIAIVRHPVGVIHSWRETPVPQREGRMPGANAFWPEMRALTDAPIDLLEKQVRMYDLICERLHALAGKIHVLRYEDFVKRPGMLCELLKVDALIGRDRIKQRDPSFYQNDALTLRIQAYLERFAEHYRAFYPPRGD